MLGPLLDPHQPWGFGRNPIVLPRPGWGRHRLCWLVTRWGHAGAASTVLGSTQGSGLARNMQAPHAVPAAVFITEITVETPLRSREHC